MFRAAPQNSHAKDATPAKKRGREERLAARKALNLKPGDVFNPAKLFSDKKLTGGLIPSEIRESKALSCGAKVAYSALMELRATQARVFPSIDRLARDIGK